MGPEGLIVLGAKRLYGGGESALMTRGLVLVNDSFVRNAIEHAAGRRKRHASRLGIA